MAAADTNVYGWGIKRGMRVAAMEEGEMERGEGEEGKEGEKRKGYGRGR